MRVAKAPNEAYVPYIPDRTEQIVIRDWFPERKPVHCSNCRNNAVSVGGSFVQGQQLQVVCTRGHGPERRKVMPYTRLMRMHHAMPFQEAKTCPDFCSMDDE